MKAVSSLVVAAALGLCAAAMLAGCGGSQPTIGAPGSMPQNAAGAHQACAGTRSGEAQCLVLIQDKGVKPACAGKACGWGPLDFQTRYKLPISRGSGQIVAVVDAYDQPNAASDLRTYRTEFGLGPASFFKYNQTGEQRDYPPSCAASSGWCVEEDLDIEMISASCPKCTIYLVEANGADTSDLEAAEVQAVALGAHIVSDSWTCGSLSCVDQKNFDTPGVAYLAAGGNTGSGEVEAPAALDTVAAIGGTALSKSGSKYSEKIWSGAAGGCATGIKKPKWQSAIPDSVCAYRLTNDVAAEAGCSPGVAEYDSNERGWFAACGTSVAASLLAGVFGLAGNATKQDGGRTFWLTAHHNHLYYIKGTCEYRQGQYTTCAGWGSPDGIGAF
jgi:subtilase family serine protease